MENFQKQRKNSDYPELGMMWKGEQEIVGLTYKRVTPEILTGMELYGILTVVVNKQNYTSNKII